jgi:hypothetical protein
MKQKRILTCLLLTTATLFLFTCGGKESPFPTKDARIDLFLENSAGQRSFASVTDTAEKKVRVGMTAYLPIYITSVLVTIAKSATEIDTFHTFDASTDWSDTQWIDMRFHSTGTRKVTVVVSIQGEQPKTDTASITIVGKNHPPTLRLLSGNKNVLPGQTCTLVFTADDVDTGTIFTYSILKGKPAAAALTDSTFTWTPGSGDTGTFPVDFLVADNGKPLMYDTLSVNITVSSQSIKTPPIIMVLQDTSVAQGKTLAFIVKTIAPAQDTVALSATDITGAKLPDSATFNPKTGLFTWTPTFSQLGSYNIVFTAANGNAVARDTVKITVTKTDRPPTVQAQSLNTSINQAITFTLAASDPDNDAIAQWQLSQKPHNGTATLADSTKANVVYTPNSGFTGVDTFTVSAYDGSLWSLAPANVIVTVTSIKIAPKIQTQPRPDTTVTQGGSVAFTVAINNASPSPAFIWYQGSKGSGTMKDSSTNPLYQKTGVTAADSGNYYVIVVNSSGADTSAYAHLKVNVPPSVPTLSSPANSATGIAVSPTLTWSAVTGAVTYRVQVSTASDFSTGIVVDDSSVTAASKALSSLTNSTLYFWRVNAKNADGTSAWSTPFSFTTIIAASGVPVLSAPANNATGVAVNPTLTWSAVTGAITYRIQVSTASDFSTGIVVDDSTLTAASKAISSLTNNTLYYWRVNAKNAGGASAWSTAFSFTTIVVAPGVPMLSVPANNATGVAVSQALSWVAVTGAATYRIQVSTASDFSTGIVADDSTLTVASKAMNSLTNNTVYYWRVNAKNAGGTSAWSAAFSFTTIVAVSGVPVNTNPTNNATGVAVNPTLTWSAVTGAITYRVQVSTANDFSAGIIVDDSSLTTASKALSSLTNSTVYFWHVNAKNAGGTSAWSTASSFTTIVAAPGVPVLSAPANNATGIAVSPTVTWNAVTGAATYRVQVSTASDFSIGIVVDDSTLTTASKAVGTLSNGTKYYWRVNAKNAGGTSAWAGVYNFTTIVAAPSAPALSSPANNATDVAVNPTLTWGAAAGAATYRVQVSTASDFSSGILVDDSTLTTGSKAVGPLSNGTKYYWRVNAKNAGGTSGWSGTWVFTTIIAAPSAPTLASPVNNATNVSITPTLVWNTLSDATTYQVQVSTVSNFASTVFNMSGLTATSQAVSTALLNSTLYYWRANATNPGGTSAWSGTWSFNTVVAAPSAPTLSSPTNALTRVSVTPTLVWSAAASATSYDVQVATDLAFSTVIFNGTGITTTSAAVSPDLSNSTAYYWHVRAVNAGGPSSWSSPWSFTTIGACSWNEVINFATYFSYPMSVATNGITVFIGTHKQGIWRSLDTGSTWADISDVYMYNKYISSFAYAGGKAIAGSASGSGLIYTSSDNGANWTDFTASGYINGFAASTGKLWAATSYGVLVSTDNGVSWGDDGGASYLPSANAVLVNNSYVYAATTGEVDSRTVGDYHWATLGSGITSTAIVYALVMYGGSLYAGADDGVYKYSASTNTWSKTNTGLPNASIISLAANSNTIFAGTNMNGIYMSTDGGATWSAISTGLPANWTGSSIALNSTYLYTASGANYGVWRSPLP